MDRGNLHLYSNWGEETQPEHGSCYPIGQMPHGTNPRDRIAVGKGRLSLPPYYPDPLPLPYPSTFLSPYISLLHSPY